MSGEMEKRQKRKEKMKHLRRAEHAKLAAKKEFHCVKKEKQSYNLIKYGRPHAHSNQFYYYNSHTPTGMEIKINKWDLIKFKRNSHIQL